MSYLRNLRYIHVHLHLNEPTEGDMRWRKCFVRWWNSCTKRIDSLGGCVVDVLRSIPVINQDNRHFFICKKSKLETRPPKLQNKEISVISYLPPVNFIKSAHHPTGCGGWSSGPWACLLVLVRCVLSLAWPFFRWCCIWYCAQYADNPCCWWERGTNRKKKKVFEHCARFLSLSWWRLFPLSHFNQTNVG